MNTTNKDVMIATPTIFLSTLFRLVWRYEIDPGVGADAILNNCSIFAGFAKQTEAKDDDVNAVEAFSVYLAKLLGKDPDNPVRTKATEKELEIKMCGLKQYYNQDAITMELTIQNTLDRIKQQASKEQ